MNLRLIKLPGKRSGICGALSKTVLDISVVLRNSPFGIEPVVNVNVSPTENLCPITSISCTIDLSIVLIILSNIILFCPKQTCQDKNKTVIKIIVFIALNFNVMSSRPGEFHPQSLTEPYLTVSHHTALLDRFNS